MKRKISKVAIIQATDEKDNHIKKAFQYTLRLIYNRLIEFLKDNRRFTNGGLTRENVAAALKTNAKYLCMAIRMYSEEKTLNKIICRMRVQYAAELLINHSDYSIEAIAQECGIKSRCSFYRMFIKHYQCTPVDFMNKFIPNGQHGEQLQNDENELKTKKKYMKWKLSNDVVMQDVGDKKVLVALNTDITDYSQVITLNGTATFIVELLSKDSYSEDELATCLCEKYNIEKKIVVEDINELIEKLEALHIIYTNNL